MARAPCGPPALSIALAACFVIPTVAGSAALAAGKSIDGVVNLNTAEAPMLELLPGIGPAKVALILAYRRRRPFRTVDELVRVKGIGRRMVRALRPHLAVSGPSTARAGPPTPGPPPAPPPPTYVRAARPPPLVCKPPLACDAPPPRSGGPIAVRPGFVRPARPAARPASAPLAARR
jgi:competence protein ComEA